jgi:hypothetical protein
VVDLEAIHRSGHSCRSAVLFVVAECSQVAAARLLLTDDEPVPWSLCVSVTIGVLLASW